MLKLTPLACLQLHTHAPDLKVEVYAGLSEIGREAVKAQAPGKRKTKKARPDTLC